MLRTPTVPSTWRRTLPSALHPIAHLSARWVLCGCGACANIVGVIIPFRPHLCAIAARCICGPQFCRSPPACTNTYIFLLCGDHSPARRCKSANVASNSPECVRCGRASDRTSVPPIPGLPLGLACGDECASSAHLPSNIPVHALMHWCMAGRMPKANQVGTPQATDQCSRASCRPCACLCASLCCTPPQPRGRTCMHVDPAAPTTSFLSLPPMRDVVLPAQHWYCTTVTCASTQHLY